MAFKLKTDRKETENKTIRFPLHLIQKKKRHKRQRIFLLSRRLCLFLILRV